MKIKNNLTEKKLTKAELEAREKVIKDLKKNKSALVKRYVKDAEAVMYGRATNIAKKMAESENKNKIKEMVSTYDTLLKDKRIEYRSVAQSTKVIVHHRNQYSLLKMSDTLCIAAHTEVFSNTLFWKNYLHTLKMSL